MTISHIFNNLFKTEDLTPSICLKLLTKQIKKDVTLEEKEKNDLIFRLNDTKMRLYIVENAFNHELKFDLIDAYIHEINSLKLQYSHLLKRARTLKITNDYELLEEY